MRAGQAALQQCLLTLRTCGGRERTGGDVGGVVAVDERRAPCVGTGARLRVVHPE